MYKKDSAFSGEAFSAGIIRNATPEMLRQYARRLLNAAGIPMIAISWQARDIFASFTRVILDGALKHS